MRVGGGDSGGHVRSDTTSRGVCGLVCTHHHALVDVNRAGVDAMLKSRPRPSHLGCHNRADEIEAAGPCVLVECPANASSYDYPHVSCQCHKQRAKS